MARTLAALEQRLELLETRYAQLEERQKWVERIFESYGIRGLWLSPAKASPLLGVSRDRIMAEIERAEKLRIFEKPSDAEYGVHYRNIQDPSVETSTWQVHVANFDRLLMIPPDQRLIP
ncbi:hypothetical protein QGP82_21605 [Leptothoe sp. LEGE 181152]|nr:hypothetical protein [Leptothoe sp. LEGE 181152]